MSLDNSRLLDFLGEIDKELKRKVVVVAVGGTAMTLLKAKSSTIDVDFTIPGEYFEEFQQAIDTTLQNISGVRWNERVLFSLQGISQRRKRLGIQYKNGYPVCEKCGSYVIWRKNKWKMKLNS